MKKTEISPHYIVSIAFLTFLVLSIILSAILSNGVKFKGVINLELSIKALQLVIDTR